MSADLKNQERTQALTDYEKAFRKVLTVKEMTDTQGWKHLWSELQQKRRECNELLLSEDKTREMIRFQEAIKLIDAFNAIVKKPIEELDNFCNSMPLFAAEFRERAVWNKNLGTITIRNIDDK